MRDFLRNVFFPQRAEDKGQAPPAAGQAPAPPEVTGRKGPPGNTPWVSQFHPAGEDATYTNGAANCAPAVAAMVARNVGYGKDLTDAQLIQNLAQAGGTTAEGTSGNGVVAMFEQMGLQTNATPGANLDWIQSELQAGHHVTALGDFYQVPGRIDPNLTAGHYIDLAGVTKDGNFLVNDPADQQVKSLTAEQLSAFISAAPTGGFAISAWKPTGAAPT